MTQTVTANRSTEVVSLSLSPSVFRELEKVREKSGQSRSAFITSLIKRHLQNERWDAIYRLGNETARKLGITSEEDIERILHEP